MKETSKRQPADKSPQATERRSKVAASQTAKTASRPAWNGIAQQDTDFYGEPCMSLPLPDGYGEAFTESQAELMEYHLALEEWHEWRFRNAEIGEPTASVIRAIQKSPASIDARLTAEATIIAAHITATATMEAATPMEEIA